LILFALFYQRSPLELRLAGVRMSFD